MAKEIVRVKGAGYHDIRVDTGDADVVFISQHSRHGRSTIVAPRATLPVLISALQEAARG